MNQYKIGDQLTLTITMLTASAEGVGLIEGYKIYVPSVLVHEEVIVELVQVNQTFAKAILKKNT